MKGVSCVSQLSCVQHATNAQNAASNLPVGPRLQNFWQIWLDLGAGLKVVQILKEGYTLPFRARLKLTRYPTVISCYANPHRNSYLMEALHQLISKNAVEPVQNQTSLGLLNWLFLVPKPNNRRRPILDLSKLNLFLKAEKFKMETPETIRARLQHTQDLVQICQELGWLVNVDKLELEPKQVFDFVGYQFDLRARRVRPTLDRWQNLQDKIMEILSLPTCPVRQFMSMIGLLTATEKQVDLGRLHMRPIQWHLKNNWIPESLEKGYSKSQVPAPSLTMVARRRQCPQANHYTQ